MKRSRIVPVLCGLAVVLALTLFIPGGYTAEAAENPTTAETTASPVNRITSAAKYKKAPKLQLGDNVVTVRRDDSYVAFTVPKKGTYVFTFSGLKGATSKTAKKAIAGYTSYTYWKADKKLHYKVGKLGKLPKDSGFVFATEYLVKNKAKYKKWYSTCPVKYSLKKGTKVYLMFYGKPTKFSVKVNVRKK